MTNPQEKSANILMLLQSDYPPDIRLAKEIKALTAAGHTVHLLCNNVQQRPQYEDVDGAQVHRLPALKRFPGALGKMVRLPLFFSPLWKKYAVSLIKSKSIDAIHVHDLPLAPLAVKLGKRFQRPVVYDMHENYPAAMAEWKKRGRFWQGWIKNPAIASLLNTYCLKRAARIIVVVEEQAENLRRVGLDTKVHVVGNTVDLDAFQNLPVEDSILDRYKQSYTVLYIGSFSTERGLETAIDAVNLLKADIAQIKLLLVGDGKNKPNLEQYAALKGASEIVEFVDWVDFSLVPSYMSASAICIIPQPSNPANDTTLPHKLFQYMALGKPVLTSDARPLRRIVQETKCGEWFASNNAGSFAEAVKKMYASKIDYSKNGQHAVRSRYNWTQTSRELLRVYSEMLNQMK